MHNVKVLERRKFAVGRQRRFDEELDFTAAGAQPVADIDAQLLTHALDHTADFRFEILRVIDHVEVRMTDPGSRGFVVELASDLDAFRATRVILSGIKFLRSVRRRDHVDDLVVSGQIRCNLYIIAQDRVKEKTTASFLSIPLPISREDTMQLGLKISLDTTGL